MGHSNPPSGSPGGGSLRDDRQELDWVRQSSRNLGVMTRPGDPKVCQPIEMDSHTGAHTSFHAQKEAAG